MRFPFTRLLPGLCFLFAGYTGPLQGQEFSFSFSDSAILQRLRRDIFILASDSFKGREAGTKGDSLAAGYIINRFRAIGLTPKGNDSGSYLQPLPYEHSYHSWVENFLATDYDAHRYRRDFGMTSFSANDKMEGDLLVAGHGIVDSTLQWDDYTGKQDPADCVLLMEFPLPRELQNDSVACRRLSIENRLAEAFRRGAAAVLLWNTDSPDYPDLFDFDHAEPMPGPVLFVTEGIARQLKRLEGQPARLGAGFTRIRTTFHNIIGFLDNGAPQTVVLGAHYDHEGLNRAGVARCGADDNASGVALMLELARYLKAEGSRRFNYMFIAFGAEELGMIGSGYFCANPVIPIETVVYMCNFDMVGRLGAEGNRITALGTSTSPQWKEVYKEMPAFPFRVKKYKGASSFSDQECFYKGEVPIFYLTTGMHPDYHTHRDRPERINYTGMVDISRYAEAFLTHTAAVESIEFRNVSGWATLFSDLNYFIKQLGHLLDMPKEDWP
ncbi:MAG: M20/M25/M40 family metallo-hydrolase [Bacteroidetes bacterium]|nr:MAG: M20/M25/M40 family metallo-hydrolase [Bacteroidota bacterium]